MWRHLKLVCHFRPVTSYLLMVSGQRALRVHSCNSWYYTASCFYCFCPQKSSYRSLLLFEMRGSHTDSRRLLFPGKCRTSPCSSKQFLMLQHIRAVTCRYLVKQLNNNAGNKKGQKLKSSPVQRASEEGRTETDRLNPSTFNFAVKSSSTSFHHLDVKDCFSKIWLYMGLFFSYLFKESIWRRVKRELVILQGMFSIDAFSFFIAGW